MQEPRKSYNTVIFLIVIFFVLFFLNLIAAEKSLKFDLTEKKLYTLNKASKTLLKNLDDVCNITAYVSKDLPTSQANIERVVRDKLNDFKEIAGDNLHFRILKVSEEDSLQMNQLREDGVSPVRIGEQTKTKVGVELVYKSMKIEYYGKSQVVVINDRTMEYDIISAIKGLSKDHRKRVGIVTSIRDPQLEEQMRSETERQIDMYYPRIKDRYPDLDKETFKAQKMEEFENQLAQNMKLNFLQNFPAMGTLMMLNQHVDIKILDAFEMRSYEWSNVQETIQGLSGDMAFMRRDQSQVLNQMFGFPFKEIPGDIDVLVLFQPSSEYSAEFLEIIDRFIAGGKSALFLIDQVRVGQMYNQKFGLERQQNINQLLGKYGVVVEKNVIFDKSCVQDEMPILENLRLRTIPVNELYRPIVRHFPSSHPILSNFRGMVFETVSMIDPSAAGDMKDVEVVPLLVSSENSRIEELKPLGAQGNMVSLPAVENIEEEQFDQKNLLFAAALEGRFSRVKEEEFSDQDGEEGVQDDASSGGGADEGESPPLEVEKTEETRLIVVGDADFASMGGGDNFNFLLNAVEWLSRDPFGLWTLRGREFSLNFITEELSEAKQTWIQIANIILAPFLVVAVSLAAWLIRKNRKNALTLFK
jgi:ABC-type uncharacterized transport system involved in gliding motility auxiliary subunit